MQNEKKALAAALKSKTNALLIGETGTCKTTLVKCLAKELDQELVRINLDGGTSTDQLVGRFQVRKHPEKDVPETFFQEGALVKAMRDGAILLLDEINAALADVLFVLHAVLEQDARLFIPETGEEVLPHKNFRIVATMNPVGDYAGTRTLNHALYSRFGCVIRFNTPEASDVLAIMKDRFPELPESTLIKIADAYEQCNKAFKEQKINTRISVRECLSACALSDSLSIKDAIDRAIYEKLDPEEQRHVSLGMKSDVPSGATIEAMVQSLSEAVSLKQKIRDLEQELIAFNELKKLADALSDARERKGSKKIEMEEIKF